MGGASALVAQPVAFASQVEEGLAFRRTVETTQRGADARGQASGTSRMTATIHVLQLREDGSGLLGVTLESASGRLERFDGTVETWDSRSPDPSDDPGQAALAGMIGRTFEVPFLADGRVDPAPFSEVPETDALTLELFLVATLAGPRDRADGLPAGFPASLDPSEPRTVRTISPDEVLLDGTYELEEISEHEGRRVATVQIRWDGASAMEEIGFPFPMAEGQEATLAGRVAFDLGAERLIESVLTFRRTEPGAGGDGFILQETEIHTELLNGTR